MMDELLVKYGELKKYLSKFGKLAIAFSSGVDSTFLLYAAKDALGDGAVAVTAALNSFPERELRESVDLCKSMGVKHIIVTVDELKIEGFAQNPTNRCYLCKRKLMESMKKEAEKIGISEIAEGSNLDDNGDYRPGLIAVSELGIRSPLREIGFTKKEIRELSEYFNLPTWNKPSYACLSSRIPYGEIIDERKLKMVEKSEQLLMDMGFNQFRVRIHNSLARIELEPRDFDKFMKKEVREEVYQKFKEYGFTYVALDILGYRTGSLNENINK